MQFGQPLASHQGTHRLLYASDDHLSRYSRIEQRSSSRMSDRIESFLNEVNKQEMDLIDRQLSQRHRRKRSSVASFSSKLIPRPATSSSATIRAPSQSRKSMSNLSVSSARLGSGIGRKSSSVLSATGSGKYQ